MDLSLLEHNPFLLTGVVLMVAGAALYHLKRLPGAIYDFVERFFIVNGTVNPVNIDRIEKAVMEELADFLAKGPSKEELADAQKAYLEAQKVGRTGDAALAGQIVTNLQLGRKFSHVSDMEKRIAALTPEDVTAAFRKHIDPKKLVIVRAGDFKK